MRHFFEFIIGTAMWKRQSAIIEAEANKLKMQRTQVVSKNVDQMVRPTETLKDLLSTPLSQMGKSSPTPPATSGPAVSSDAAALKDYVLAYETLGLKRTDPSMTVFKIRKQITKVGKEIKSMIAGPNKEARQQAFDRARDIVGKDRPAIAAKMREIFGGTVQKDFFKIIGARRFSDISEIKPLIETKLKALNGKLLVTTVESEKQLIRQKISEIQQIEKVLTDPAAKQRYEIDLLSQADLAAEPVPDPFVVKAPKP